MVSDMPPAKILQPIEPQTKMHIHHFYSPRSVKLKKMHLPKGNASFCSANPDPKNAFTFGWFLGVAKNAEKRVQECQDWNYPGPRLSNPESIWHLSKVDLFFYLCIFVSFYFSIFLSIYLSVYLWQFDYLLTFDGSKQAAGHQISQNAVQDPKGHAFWICVCSKGICIFVKFWEIRFAWWNVINLRFTGFRSPKWSFHRWRIGCFRIWKFQAEAPKTINTFHPRHVNFIRGDRQI